MRTENPTTQGIERDKVGFQWRKVHQHELTQRVIKKHHWTHTSASQNSKYFFSTVWKEPLRRYSKQAPLSAHWEPNYVGNREEERSGRFSRKKGPPTVVKKRSSRKAVCEPLLSRIFFLSVFLPLLQVIFKKSDTELFCWWNQNPTIDWLFDLRGLYVQTFFVHNMIAPMKRTCTVAVYS